MVNSETILETAIYLLARIQFLLLGCRARTRFIFQVRVVLNKAQEVDKDRLLKVYGALMWSISRCLGGKTAVPKVYVGSFWDGPRRHPDDRCVLRAPALRRLRCTRVCVCLRVRAFHFLRSPFLSFWETSVVFRAQQTKGWGQDPAMVYEFGSREGRRLWCTETDNPTVL